MSMESSEIVREKTGEIVPSPKIDSDTFSVGDVRDQIILIQELMKGVMLPGEHYGKIPGCGDKDVLFKAGAEKLCLTFRMAPKYTVEVIDKDPHREYRIGCELYHIVSGRFLGAGVGSASTMESKHRYRRDAQRNKIENPDIADQYNTVLKMAKKRALVDAVLTATAASDIFTQDLEDMQNDTPVRSVAMPRAKEVAKTEGSQAVGSGVDSVDQKPVVQGPGTETPESLEKKLRPPESKFFAPLHAAARKAGISNEKMKTAIRVLYNKESSKDLLDSEAAALIRAIERGGIK